MAGAWIVETQYRGKPPAEGIPWFEDALEGRAVASLPRLKIKERRT
jgi:hypothetical protein